MPEFKQMNNAVEKKKLEAQTKVQKMYDDYQAKLKDLNQYGQSMMEAVREEKSKELAKLQKDITDYEQKATADIQEYQQKLIQPLNDKYLKMVKEVAKENGYTYIFDLAGGMVTYYPEKDGDITELVKKKMGIN
jgi:outer membrane protein